MFKIFRTFLLIVFLVSTTTSVYSESTWIKKKTDKTKTASKSEKVEKKKSEWIKKKKNKKKLKEKIKESKSWITKKSKTKIKDIKKKLKKHKDIENVPKAELYFAAIIYPNENEDPLYMYGYINSDKKSEKTKKFKFKNKVFYSNSDGIAFFDDNKTACQIDVLKDEVFEELKGKAIIRCKNKEVFSADINFDNNGKFGKGYDVVFKGGLSGELEFFDTKTKTIAKLENYKTEETRIVGRELIQGDDKKKILLKPTGKYYALLIGNSKYIKWASLTSPVNDITEISNILKNKYKFERVMVVKNGNRKNIFTKLKELSKITTDNDYILIYYAGHGEEEGTQRYWIPVNGEKEYGFGDWININDIQVYIQDKISNRHLVMMSDSCYFAMDTKGNQINKDKKSESYQKLLNRRAVMIVGSGSNEPVVDTSQDKHSMFGYSFIQSLRNNDSAIRMRDIVENIIVAHSGMQQQPYGIGIGAWGHGGGDFIFIAKK